MRIGFLESGSCSQISGLAVKGEPFKRIDFPSSVAVIEHPREGIILFDTGYSMDFLTETKRFPEKFYALVTPVKLTREQTAREQLKNLGIAEKDVRHIILSHFHADHCSGVRDFGSAHYHYLKAGYDRVIRLGRWGGVRHGFLKGVLPSDFEARSKPITGENFNCEIPEITEFGKGFDLLGDGSLTALPLEGHMIGHMGLLVRTQSQGAYFLVGDAAWSQKAIIKESMPSSLAMLIVDKPKAYRETLRSLSQIRKRRSDLKIVPCHCHSTVSSMPHISSWAQS